MDTTREGLEFQSDRIEAVLWQYGIEKSRIEGGAVTPRAIIFNVSTELQDGNGLTDALARALGVPVRIDGNTITVKRTDAEPVKLLSLMARLANENNILPFTATLGMCDDGAPLLIRLPSKKVGHILISGLDGCGKTSLLRTIVISLALCNRSHTLKFVLVGDSLNDLRRLPGVLNYTAQDLAGLLGRQVLCPRIILVLDGFAMPTIDMDNILRLGHSSGVHVISSQSVSSAKFTTLIKGSNGAGDFTAIAAGQEIPFMAAYITPAEVEQIVMGASPRSEPTRLQRAAMTVVE